MLEYGLKESEAKTKRVFIKVKLNAIAVTPTAFLCYLLWMFPLGILYRASSPSLGPVL